MLQKGIRITFTALMVLTTPLAACAQKAGMRYPAVVLVQLRSEHNRIAGLQNTDNKKRLAEVYADAQAVQGKMKLDFHDHFHYCPVLYYMDTNATLVKEQKFEGVLMEEDGTPAKSMPTGSNYMIAYYGYPLHQWRNEPVLKDSTRYTADMAPTNMKGLTILNSSFLQLTYFYKFAYFLSSRSDKPYIYKSKHFDIEYFPFASAFDDYVKTSATKP